MMALLKGIKGDLGKRLSTTITGLKLTYNCMNVLFNVRDQIIVCYTVTMVMSNSTVIFKY